jgi:SulP family sulfate permease
VKIAGDAWAGLAVMLVVLPASVAFGVTIYAAIGAEYAGLGAFAGVLGAVALGIIAPILGGTDRLVTAPCAPATALMSAFAIDMVHRGTPPETVILLMMLLGVLTGLFQVLIGFTRIGSLVKYLPHTVVSGYMTAVGLIIIFSQLVPFLGVSAGQSAFSVMLAPELWAIPAIVVGLATALGMGFAGRFITFIPSTIVGILLGLVTYWLLSLWLPELRQLEGNKLVLGNLGVSGAGYVEILSSRWLDLGQVTLGQVAALFGTALTLAALLSIDSLKTGIVTEQITHSAPDANQELVAQGLANIASASVGGVPGAGTIGATLVNISSGAQTRYAAMVAAVLSLLGLVVLIGLLAWLPKATLAAVLIVIGVRMIDLSSLKLITSRATVFDFVVVVSVVVVALSFGLIAASATGVALSILLFLREQVGGTVIRRKSFLTQRSSSWYRSEEDMKLLEQKGASAVIFELQGSLFFGVSRQLYLDLEHEARIRQYLIIDMLRVVSIDVTAAHVLQQTLALLKEHNGQMVLCNLRESQRSDLLSFLAQMGFVEKKGEIRIFSTLDESIEWVENKIIARPRIEGEEEVPLHLQEMDLFRGRKEATISELESSMTSRVYAKGDKIYSMGDPGDALYLLRRGQVKIIAPIGGSRRLHHIATFGRGNFFGGLSFLDAQPRGDIALADTEVEVFVLTREQFEHLSESHKRIAFLLMQSIARTLGQRLRRTDGELTMLLE